MHSYKKSSLTSINSVVYIVLILFVWTVFTTLINDSSSEALFSSSRLLFEVLFVRFLIRNFIYTRTIIESAVFSVSIFNSILVMLQTIDSTGLFYIGVAKPFHDFWNISQEFSRNPGFFNSYLTSSLLSLASMMIVLSRKIAFSSFVFAVNLFATFFGSRTLMPFALAFALIYLMRHKVFFVFAIVLTSIFFIFPSQISDLLQFHFEERVVPLVKVIITGDLSNDYSSSDMISHYRTPTLSEVFIGNGHPRYSPLGGMDPAVTRWLFQTGVIGLFAVLYINLVISVRLFSNYSVCGLVFALALLTLMFKGEIATSGIVFSVVLILAFAKKIKLS